MIDEEVRRNGVKYVWKKFNAGGTESEGVSLTLWNEAARALGCTLSKIEYLSDFDGEVNWFEVKALQSVGLKPEKLCVIKTPDHWEYLHKIKSESLDLVHYTIRKVGFGGTRSIMIRKS